jgi:heat shock protein HslJ
MLRILTFTAAAILLGGCGPKAAEQTTTPVPPAASAELAGTRWALEGSGDKGADSKTTLEFLEDGKMSGFAGCNRMTGTYAVSGNRLTFGAIATTRKLCPPAMMDPETKYLAALARARRFALDEAGRLSISGEGVSEPLRFSRLSER